MTSIPATASALTAPSTSALIPATMKKSGLVWLEIGTYSPVAVWHVWHNDVCYVLHVGTESNGTEQAVPGLAEATQCHVITRSATTHARTARWRGTVHSVSPDSAEWDELLPLLIANRLNLRSAGNAPQRWARKCVLSRIVPAVSTGG